jgi:thiosulfate reductase cytochrome b subunit
MGVGSVISGLAIYKPTQLSWLTALLGGYEWARWEHFYLMVGYVLFFVVHIFQVAMAGWANFRSMITGYDVIDTIEAKPEPSAAVEEVPA